MSSKHQTIKGNPIFRNKVGLLNLAEELGNVSKACKVISLSRDSFYQCKSAVEEGGIQALFDKNRRQPNLKNRVDEVTDKAVSDFAIEFPGMFAKVCQFCKTKGAFTSESAHFKLVYCACQKITEKWAKPLSNWALTISQLSVYFEGRLK